MIKHTQNSSVIDGRAHHCDALRAFTLVELLVVVGIIAVLIAILLPALSSARRASRNTSCLSNLRQINISINFYASDFRGYAVPASFRKESDGGPKAYPGYPTWRAVTSHHYPLLGQYTGIRPTSGKPEGDFSPKNTPWRCAESDTEVAYSMASRITASGAGQFFAHVLNDQPGSNGWGVMRRLSAGIPAPMIMTFIDKDIPDTFGFNGSWPMTGVPFYGNPRANPVPHPGYDKNMPGATWNHHMRHPPYAGRTPVGTNMGFLDGHAATLVNRPSNIAGHYWLKPLYGREFILRPEDYGHVAAP